MIPLWQYVGTVLILLFTHGMTVFWAKRRIRELEGALVVRDVLLDGPGADAAGFSIWGGKGGVNLHPSNCNCPECR